MLKRKHLLATLLSISCLSCGVTSEASDALDDEPLPIVPVGEDAYLMWDRLPYHCIGVRGAMHCTYDRQGLNRAADASHFLYQVADDFNVTMDVAGPGMLYFVRTNHHHGSPWHYETDGEKLLVKETATDNPVGADKRLTDSIFMPKELFPHPLTWTWPTTKGADLMWRPIPFKDSLRLAYSRTFYGTGYYIFHRYAMGSKHLSREIDTWKREPPDPRVLKLLESAGSDIAPQGDHVTTSSGTLNIGSQEWQPIACRATGPTMIRALKFIVPKEQAEHFGKCRLRITWDNRWHPSIDAPIEAFFGAGILHNNDDREFLVKGLPVSVRYADDKVHLSCYWPMPFFQSARIELQNRSDKLLEQIQYEVRSLPFDDPPNHVGYFHATYSNHPTPTPGQDVVFLDTDQQEGGGPWSGKFVGMSWVFSRRGVLHTLEGDPRFYFDDSLTPQAMGTGTEEWGGGGDYWGGRNMTIPLAGHPVGKKKGEHQSPQDLINSAYRFLVADYFPFGKRAVIGLEHGEHNMSDEHYSGVVYWYGSPSPTLVLTDKLNVCDERDVKYHNYSSPTAEAPYPLVSHFDGGPDRDISGWRTQNKAAFGAHPYSLAVKDTVRVMTGVSQFTMRLSRDNHGVMLRRRFDYQYPNQRASVSVRPAGSDEDWQYVGQWYTAGSNTCVYSRPPGKNFTAAELAPTQHNAITGNRRWREEEFLIPQHLTRGHEKLEIQIEYLPDRRPLFPGHDFPVRNAWSESRYWAYCYRLPDAP